MSEVIDILKSRALRIDNALATFTSGERSPREMLGEGFDSCGKCCGNRGKTGTF